MALRSWVYSHYPEKGNIVWLAFGLEVISVLVLFFLMSLTCLDVFGRYVLNNSIDGSIELTRTGLAVLVFAEMPVITWRGGHVVVDLVDDFLDSKIIKMLALLSAFLISTSLYFVGFRIFELAQRSMRNGVVTEFLQMPEGYIMYYVGVMSWVTAAMMISYGVHRIWVNR